MPDYYAHSKPGKSPSEWEPLEEHLKHVADLATEFASVFGAGTWGKLAGEIHDIGKATLPWQAYLRKVNSVVDKFTRFYDVHVEHSVHGAR